VCPTPPRLVDGCCGATPRRAAACPGDGGKCEAFEPNPIYREDGVRAALVGGCLGAVPRVAVVRPGDGAKSEALDPNPIYREDSAWPAVAGGCRGAIRRSAAACPGDGAKCEVLDPNPLYREECRADDSRPSLEEGGRRERSVHESLRRDPGANPCHQPSPPALVGFAAQALKGRGRVPLRCNIRPARAPPLAHDR
jgi:hypothetical protein